MHHFRSSFVVIPMIALFVASIGSAITGVGMEWYHTINLPAWTPPGQLIGFIWTIIFILTAASALLTWNRFPRDRRFVWIVSFFVLNAFLNLFGSYLFFSLHTVAVAADEAALLCLSVLILIALTWKHSSLAALLLVPYALWSGFATYLTVTVWWLNG